MFIISGIHSSPDRYSTSLPIFVELTFSFYPLIPFHENSLYQQHHANQAQGLPGVA
jgi:hypothetical protein